MADINPKVPLSKYDLQKIKDRARQLWHKESNNEYDANEWTALCYITATIEHFGLEAPPQIRRDFLPAHLED